jgi:hypothetical protein
MTLMLASVSGPQEAEIAIAHGADIVDLKDSANGAFGAVAPDVVPIFREGPASVQSAAGSPVARYLPLVQEMLVRGWLCDAVSVACVKWGCFRPKRPDCIRACPRWRAAPRSSA